MAAKKQAEFARRAKKALIDRGLSVTGLASRIGRRRDTVSTAIHSARFPKVRAQIEKHLSL